MSDIWFPGMKQPLHLSPEDFRRLEEVVLADQRAKEYDPHWQRKVLLDFVAKHPALDINEVSDQIGWPVEGCKDKLHYHKLEKLCKHFAEMRAIKPANVVELTKLTEKEQADFVQRAVRLAPADFRIEVFDFLRIKARTYPIPLLTMVEIAQEAIGSMHKLKATIKRLRCELQSANEALSSLHAAYRRAVGPDPERYYKD